MIYAGMIWLLDSLLTWRSGKLTRSESSPEKSHANVEFARVKFMIAHPRSRFQPAYRSILNGIINVPVWQCRAPFTMTGAAALMAALYGWLRLPETRKPQQPLQWRRKRPTPATPATSSDATDAVQPSNSLSSEQAAQSSGQSPTESSTAHAAAEASSSSSISSTDSHAEDMHQPARQRLAAFQTHDLHPLACNLFVVSMCLSRHADCIFQTCSAVSS